MENSAIVSSMANGLLMGIGQKKADLTSIMRITGEVRFVEHCSDF